MSIHHGYSYLLSKNIKHFFVVGPSDALLYKLPKLEIPTLDKEIVIQKYMTDKALDNLHMGPNTHKTIAKEIFNKINVIR